MKFNLARSMDYSREPAINNNKAMDFFISERKWEEIKRNQLAQPCAVPYSF